MEQQQTKLPLEWLSSRRTPELHRLEQLCRETAREHRCAQRRLQEVEEAMASEQEKACPEALPAASGPTQLEQLSRKLNAANAELRRYETRMFAYERTMLSLRKENAELTARCEELRSELDKYPPPRCGWMFRPHSPRSRSRRRLHRHRLLRIVNRKQSWNTSATRSWPSLRS